MFSAKPACASRSRRAPISRRLSLVFTLFALAAAAPAAKAQPPSDPPATRDSYRLAATWKDVPWQPTAGHFQRVLDLDAAPDGTVWVLERDDYYARQTLQQQDAEGRSLVRIDVDNLVPRNLDQLEIGADGRIYLGLQGNRIYRLGADGRLIDTIVLQRPPFTQSGYRFAVDADGRLHVARQPFVSAPDCSALEPGWYPALYQGTGIDVFTPDGTWLEAYGQEHLALIQALDVHPDGRTYVLSRLASQCDCRNLPPPPPVPTSTPRPSLAGAEPAADPSRGTAAEARASWSSDAPARLAEAPGDGLLAIDGLVAFDSGRQHVSSSRNFAAFQDVAATAGGIGAIRNGAIKMIEGAQATYLWQGHNDVNDPRLTITSGGYLVGTVNTAHMRGTGWIEPGTKRLWLVGETDSPKLGGPLLPLRLSIGHALNVLQGSLCATCRPMLMDPYSAGATSVQGWPLQGAGAAGRPSDQVGQPSNRANNGSQYPSIDLAADGDILYTLAPTRVERLLGWQEPDLVENRWYVNNTAAQRPHLEAIAARGGKVAVLDIGKGQVELMNGDLVPLYTWAYRREINGLPTDIALDPSGGVAGGARIFVADRGRNRILVHEQATGETREWPVHDGPMGIDVGPTGDLFVVGRGGWGMRYDPAGMLKAYWRVPHPAMEVRDIAVDAAGKVYINYVSLGEEVSANDVRRPILAAGIWVFEPTEALVETDRLPEIGACLVEPDKRVSPAEISLGGSVGLRLTLSGSCPGRSEPVALVIALDTSYSMSYAKSLGYGTAALRGILQELDAAVATVGLVTFGDGAALAVPLTDRFDDVLTALMRTSANGDTRMAAGIDLAAAELTGPRVSAGRRKVLLIVSDGIPKDEPLEAAERARAAGIDTFGLIIPYSEFGSDQVRYLQSVVGGPEHYLLNPSAERLSAFARGLTRYHKTDVLLRTVTVTDEIPANMDLVPGSVQPPADRSGQLLTWTLKDIAEDPPLELRYQLRPQAVGEWPTNVAAEARFTDGWGSAGRVSFPVPRVRVRDRRPIYLPAVARNACNLVGQPFDVVLAIDSSSSMREPMPGGGTRMDAVRAAAMMFATALDPRQHRVAVIDFNSQATRRSGFTANQALTVQAIQAIEIHQGTRIDQALLEARQLIDEERRPTARSAVVLLTDGQQGEGASDALALAGQLRAAGTPLFAIGLGDGTDQAFLRGLGGDAAHTFPTTDGQNLGAVYMQIVSAITCRWP